MTDAPSAAMIEGLFEGLLAHSADPVLLTQPDGAILRANPAACRALGRTEPEIRRLGRSGLVIRTAELEATMAERARTGRAKGEVLFLRPDGSTFPADFTSTVIPTPGDAPVTLVIFRDVSGQRRLQQSLRESEERFRAAFQTLPDAVTITEMETGLFVAVNEGARAVTGWSEAEMVGRTANDLRLWHDDDRAAFVERLRAEGAVRDLRTHLQRKDGAVLDVVISARPVVASGRPLLITVTRDLTRQLEAERARDALQTQLWQSQKLEAVGRLAGGVAHDFNNLLTVILSCTEALQALGGSEELDEIMAAGERARDLTRQLLAFARKQVIRPVPLDLNDLLCRSERMLRRLLGEDVELLVAPQRDLWTVSCDPAQLEQVVLNLAVNARDALPRGGRLLLETANVELDEAGAAPYPGARPDRYVRLTVLDNGIGMTREVIERAFEPFFTTKETGRGTGLGLATVQGIVEQSGGFIRLESEPGRWTRVEVLFPAVAQAPAAAASEPAASALGGDETLLFVEDDAGLRRVFARALRDAGYRVLVAPCGADALALAAGREQIDLVVSDVVMPGMSGRQLVDALRGGRPGLRALFISGYPDEVVARDLSPEAGVELLWKPFTARALLARVRGLLDA